MTYDELRAKLEILRTNYTHYEYVRVPGQPLDYPALPVTFHKVIIMQPFAMFCARCGLGLCALTTVNEPQHDGVIDSIPTVRVEPCPRCTNA